MAVSSSAAAFFAMRKEDQNPMKQQHSSAPSSSTAAAPVASAAPLPKKKRRNQPGTPNPDAEVIALSPRTLMATNRFVCEVCNKGFQREQNLQLHRRGHNLPWKLKHKTTKEVKKKVYLCPEPTCVHHDPSRALGDLTGIKKHFSRKHGEKKYKCEKCSKKYAVQSDWKAHTKTCGTREYRCDCGTLFSRRDSFITHRAFCDALAQETARYPPTLNTIGSCLYGNSNISLGLSQMAPQISSLHDQNLSSADILRLGNPRSGQFDNIIGSSIGSAFRPAQTMPSSSFLLPETNQDYHQHHHDNQSQLGLIPNKSTIQGLMQISDLHNNESNSSSVANLFNLSFFSNSSNNSSIDNSSNANNSSNISSSNLLIPNQFNNGHSNACCPGGEGSNLFSGNLVGDGIGSTGFPSLYSATTVQNHNVSPPMSATALLQKAAQMGSTTSSNRATLLKELMASGSSSSSGTKSDVRSLSDAFGGCYGGDNNGNHLHDLMKSLARGGSSASFGGAMNTYGSGHDEQQQNSYGSGGAYDHHNNIKKFNLEQPLSQNPTSFGTMDRHQANKSHSNLNLSVGGSDRLTRDFLGVGEIMKNISTTGVFPLRELRHLQSGHDMDSLDSENRKIQQKSQTFGVGNLQ